MFCNISFTYYTILCYDLCTLPFNALTNFVFTTVFMLISTFARDVNTFKKKRKLKNI